MSSPESDKTSIYPVTHLSSNDRKPLVGKGQYDELYQLSVEDNEEFWLVQAASLAWAKPFSTVKDVSFAKDDLHIRWFEDGELNVCVNCVDRHLESRA
mgnify:CR=1 FL=1